jgi:hypothetical protein
VVFLQTHKGPGGLSTNCILSSAVGDVFLNHFDPELKEHNRLLMMSWSSGVQRINKKLEVGEPLL